VFRSREESEIPVPHATGRKKEPVDPIILLKVKLDVIDAQKELDEAEAVMRKRTKIRDEAIHRAKSLGLSLRDIAPLMGRSTQRVAQISASNRDDGPKGEEEQETE
jgi:hypothetical protein